MQTALRLVFPPQCLTCREPVDSDFGLCGPCWRDLHRTTGLVCDLCGTPLPGDSDREELCDDCLTIARPWTKGRAALTYSGTGRALVLALKHADRLDIARPAADWMARSAAPLIRDDTVILPVPLHWRRRLRRRYNQSAVLAQHMSRVLKRPWSADVLHRPKSTASLDGQTRDARFQTLSEAIALNARSAQHVSGRAVLLVDDVMTSGATLAACCEALRPAHPREVCVITLARVRKEA